LSACNVGPTSAEEGETAQRRRGGEGGGRDEWRQLDDDEDESVGIDVGEFNDNCDKN
jgi:hypothetical protein